MRICWAWFRSSLSISSPRRRAATDATGLYAGEQDMFCFLIDPAGWTEIGGQAFAPGFFIWNSEVGSRTVGIETFWFQAICQNHIVWDAVEVVQFTRKHTANVHESLNEIRRIIEALVARRDERRDGFAKVIQRAMETRLGDDADEVRKILAQQGILPHAGQKGDGNRPAAGILHDLLAGRRTDPDRRHAAICGRPNRGGPKGRPVVSPCRVKARTFVLRAVCAAANRSVTDTLKGVTEMSKKPVHEIRLGRIKAAVWENETQNGTRHNVTISRLYKDGDDWKDSSSFGRDDLPLVAKVVDQAHSWIFQDSRE